MRGSPHRKNKNMRKILDFPDFLKVLLKGLPPGSLPMDLERSFDPSVGLKTPGSFSGPVSDNVQIFVNCIKINSIMEE